MATTPNFSPMIENIRKTLPEGRYGQTCMLLLEYFEYSTYIPRDAWHLAEKLLDADKTEPLTPAMVKFMKSIFQYFIDKGEEGAMNDMGCLYYSDRLGTPDYKKAVKYYSMAEENGSVIAAENLGYCYYYGKGTKVDYRKAFHYFNKGAISNRSESMYKLGDMYRYGFYVTQDPKMAAQCYINALKLSDNEEPADRYMGCILKRVGDLYYEGIGCDIDYKEANKYYHYAEVELFDQIARGDQLHGKVLEEVIERIDCCRARLRSISFEVKNMNKDSISV